jgi:hypothetical protein
MTYYEFKQQNYAKGQESLSSPNYIYVIKAN